MKNIKSCGKGWKKFLYVLVIAVAAFFAARHAWVKADDYEGEYEQEDGNTQTNTQPVQQQSSSQPKTKKITITSPSTIVTKTVIKSFDLKDSDKDGLPDESDPHPDIAEIYIAQDDNNNGIVDRYDPSLMK
ncbi:MAG TPA: hypothetical protein VF817_02865 [Patescibacteria group bacterium]